MSIPVNDIKNMPIFLGLTIDNLMEISGRIHPMLRHYKKGSKIVDEGEPCDMLICLVKGWLVTEAWADNRSYHIKEMVQAPQMLEPDKLFGLSRRYGRNSSALTGCTTISITKDDLSMLMDRYMIVRLNLLNAVCRKAQMLERLPWQYAGDTITQRVCRFIKQRCSYPAGRKTLYIKSQQLADELSVRRTDVAATLHELQDAEKIIWRRGIIEVPALQLL